MAGERTEKPTPKRQREASREGRVARTADFATWAGLFVASTVLPKVVAAGTHRLSDLTLRIGGVIRDPDPHTALALLGTGLRDAGLIAAPLVLAMLVVGVVASLAQTRGKLATKNLKPSFKRLNPATGIKRLFGPQSAWEALKSLLKSAVVALLVYRAVRSFVPVVAASGALPLAVILQSCVSAVLSLLRVGSLAGLLMACADYAVVRRRTNKGLRMSKHEVKEEAKQTDGNPEIKGRIRQRMLQVSRNRMIADVASADVVVVNPTHVAVALRYDPAFGAPRVVAKGADHLATRIREAATEARVPLVEDVPLARALFAACELGDEIPAETFAAVARVLAFVLQLKTRGSAAGLHRPALAHG